MPGKWREKDGSGPAFQAKPLGLRGVFASL